MERASNPFLVGEEPGDVAAELGNVADDVRVLEAAVSVTDHNKLDPSTVNHALCRLHARVEDARQRLEAMQERVSVVREPHKNADGLEAALETEWWEPLPLPAPKLLAAVVSRVRDERDAIKHGLPEIYWGDWLRKRLVDAIEAMVST